MSTPFLMILLVMAVVFIASRIAILKRVREQRRRRQSDMLHAARRGMLQGADPNTPSTTAGSDLTDALMLDTTLSWWSSAKILIMGTADPPESHQEHGSTDRHEQHAHTSHIHPSHVHHATDPLPSTQDSTHHDAGSHHSGSSHSCASHSCSSGH